MSETAERAPDTKRTLGERFRHQPTWKKLLIVGGALLLVAGVVFQILAWMNPPQIPPAGTGGGELTGSLVESSGGGDPVTVKSSDKAWSEGFFKLGFSFFAGFAIGSFVRGFLKMFLFLAGGLLLVLFGLEYAGVTNIDWNVLDRWFDSARDKIIGEANSVREFISTRLPSGGLAGLGLFAGFKKG